MVGEDYVSLELAMLAKDKGFKDVWCDYSFVQQTAHFKDGTFSKHMMFAQLPCDNTREEDFILADPTQTCLANWVRENYQYSVTAVLNDGGKYSPIIQDVKTGTTLATVIVLFDSFPKAMEDGLFKVFKLIQN